MAYIGPPPSQKLATPTSQYFSGNGSATSFTLNRPVNVAEDLNVYVNNVAQQPGVGKSYTATGTTLTFDAAPASGTNNVYVVYRGLAEPTTRLEHPSGQPLAATTGTFSGGVTASGGLNVGTIKEATGTNTAISIDSTGFASGLMVNAGRQSLASANGYIWTGIPSTARKIIVVYRLFFTQASVQDKTTLLRIGSNADAGNGIVTSGYESVGSYMGGGSSGTESDTTGFFSYYWSTGTQNQIGKYELTYLHGNGWICSGQAMTTEVGSSATNTVIEHTGYKALSGALDRVEIKIKDGTTTYNANSEAVLYYMG